MLDLRLLILALNLTRLTHDVYLMGFTVLYLLSYNKKTIDQI